MVFHCSLCGDESRTPESLIFHLQLRHSSDSVINNFKCLQDPGCFGLVFDSLSKFRFHLVNKHSNDIGLRNLNEHAARGPLDLGEDGGIINHAPPDAPPEANNDNEIPDFESFANAVHSSGLMFVSKLYDKDTLPRCVVQDVVSFVDTFLGSFVHMLKRKVLHTLDNVHDNDNLNADVGDIDAMFKVMENPFAQLSTEAQRITALKNAGAYIGPSSYFIGSSLKQVTVNGVMVPEMVPSYGQFICMKRTLQSFLELPGVFENIMLNYANLFDEDNVISNFIQGSLWKHISEPYVAAGKIVLPLFLYSDEYEGNNALGSHAVDEKTNGVYYKIPCIPSEFLSLLRYIFVAAVFFAKDRKDYGMPACVSCVLDQLKDLEENGIVIELPDRTITVYFLLGLILGDNLGLNIILGYVECFSANFCCRICKVYRENLKYLVREDPALLRTPENYANDLTLENVAMTGIKEECPFNVLQAFHATVNITGDVLHDVEESLCGYALPRILYWLIHVRQYLTYETFLDRVGTFNYGPSECGNRPPISKLSRDRIVSRTKFLLSGSESLCLTQNLGLMIGDLIPADEEVWSYYICLLELLDFVLSPSFTVGTEMLVRTLVTEHHEMYIATFDEGLKPIHHMLLHYHRYMSLIGPPIHTSTKRFESKNRESVQAARSTNSRVNLLLTLMIKNQLKFSLQLLSKNTFQDRFVSSAGKLLRVGDLPYGPNLDLDDDMTVTLLKWIDYKGTNYKVDHIVVYQTTHLFPKFGKIVAILLYGNNHISFVLSVLETINFRDHYHSFLVCPTPNIYVCHPSTLVSHQALWLRTNPFGEHFVSLRYSVH